jgi:pimeloyl-ACP methyl ester carboxylesterase
VLVDAAGYSVSKDVDPRSLSRLNPSTREAAKLLLSLIFYNKQMFATDDAADLFLTRKVTAGDGYTVQRFLDSITHNEDVIEERLSAIKHPTLIIWGREDALTSLAMGERFKKDIPGSELLIIEKCGHVPQIEKATEFNAALMKFLSGDSQ